MMPYSAPWNTVNKFKEAWESAKLASPDHPYLVTKKVEAHDIRQSGDGLVIAIFSGEEIVGIQTISPDGTKKFMYGSSIDGGYYAINTHIDDKSVIYIAEGFATAASIAEQTGCVVICAFNAGNLPKTAAAIRQLLPDSKIIVAADGEEIGRRKADEAALLVNGVVVYAPDDQDFNDVSIVGHEAKTPVKRVEVVREYADYSQYDGDFDKEDIDDMLSYVSSDIAYDDWIRIGMSIKAAGGTCGQFDAWSRKSPKYKKNDAANHWTTFNNLKITAGTLVYFAKEAGWIKAKIVKPHLCDIDINSILSSAKKKFSQPKITTDEIVFDGLIGRTVDWINSTATFQQPMLTTMNVLAALGAVFGRKYALPFNTRTNVYMVGTAETGQGKDHSRKQISNLFEEAGLLTYLGDNNVRSDSGVVKSLYLNASQVMMVDEFGLFLSGMKDAKAPAHVKAVGKLFLEMYSSSSSTYKHGTYASKDMDSMVLKSPNLCLFGTTTEETYAAALSKDGIKSGELNRFIVLPGIAKPKPCHEATYSKPSQALVDEWKSISHSIDGNNLSASNSCQTNIEPTIVGWGSTWSEVCDLLDYQCERRDEPNGALWARYRENVLKIALIYALTEMKFELESKHILAGRKLIDVSIAYMNTLAKSHMAENQWEELHNEFVQEIAKKPGREIRKADLALIMKKVRRRDFNEMLESMKDAGILDIENRSITGGAGRPTIYVKLT